MLPAIIVSPDEKFRDNTRKLLEADFIEVRTENEIKNMESAIVIVDVTSVNAQGFQTIQKTIELYKHGYVFVAGDRNDRNLVISCMLAGAKEFLSAPIESQQLFLAIERVRKVTSSPPLR